MIRPPPDSTRNRPPLSLHDALPIVTGALNAQLRPAPIAIVGCEIVAGDWHARFACVGRAYEYRIVNRRAPLTWDKGLSWQVARPLDTDAMHAAAQQLIGLQDRKSTRLNSSH